MARTGARGLVLGGTAALAASTAVLPFVTAPWQLYAAYLVMAFGWAGLTSAAISTILARWFDRRRGLAISLALNGASSGGIVILETLNILEHLGVSKMDRWSPDYLHLRIEAARRAYADRARWLGDPDFVSVPVARLTSKAYADTLARAISRTRASKSVEIGSDMVTGAINRGPVARMVARTSGGLLRLFLIAIALLWLIPTFGLLVESLRDPATYTGGGWWQVFAHPAQLTFDNYSQILKDHAITDSFFNTIYITVPATALVILIGAADHQLEGAILKLRRFAEGRVQHAIEVELQRVRAPIESGSNVMPRIRGDFSLPGLVVVVPVLIAQHQPDHRMIRVEAMPHRVDEKRILAVGITRAELLVKLADDGVVLGERPV